MPAIFNDKNIITINADISNEPNTILLPRNSMICENTVDEPTAADNPKEKVGAVILNITRPIPMNKIEITHKYGIKLRLTGLPNINN